MTAGRSIRVRAFAKVNLSLRLLGTRPDGYHELRTVFQSLALHDTLVIEGTRGELRIECDDPQCPADETNLVWRAAARLWRAAGRRGKPRGATLRLAKRIPMQAGLGGGSSDAAAALVGLSTLWAIDLGRERQLAIAASLGADVPFFLEGGTVIGLSRGDVLFPLADAPHLWMALAVPAFGVSTADAYRWWDDDFARSRRSGARKPTTLENLSRGLAPYDVGNDLEPPVARRHPEIRRLIGALRGLGAGHAAMSGSGSAVFGFFGRRSEAERAARAIAGAVRYALVTETVDRARYARLARRRTG